MTTGKTTRNKRKPNISAVNKRQTPWLMIGGIVLVVLLAAVFIGYPLVERAQQRAFIPAEDNRDPSLTIPGVVAQQYNGGQHIRLDQQVAYTQSPPYGGTHDGFWAACSGVVYPTAVRSENLVHSLEHGAVWIAYDPEQVTGEALDTLTGKVDGQPYTVMSPYPGLDQPISLQSWGHQLKLASADDERIDQFIRSLRLNKFAYPEVGASCDALGPGAFDQDNPPPFRPAPPPNTAEGKTVFGERDRGSAGATPDGAVPGQ